MICFNPKEIIDISMPLVEGMKVYKGREAKKPRFENQVNHQTGTVHESLLSMNLHTGTHIDTKLHMIDDGERLEALAISDFIAPAIVLDFSHIQNAITKTDIEEKIASLAKKNILKKGSVTTILKEHFVILKTKNSFEDILEGAFIYLQEDGAEYLAKMGLRGVGIDALGIERDQPNHGSHLALMEEDIHILEGLRLGHVAEGCYTLLALPLSIIGVEASPVRAVLFPSTETTR
jgi:arylformamidase